MKKCRHGFQIFNSKDIWIGRSFKDYGEYAESEMSIFPKLIKGGQCVVDVGAYVGSHTVCFSRLVGKDGSVLSFEPERMAYYCLCGTMALNGFMNVFCFQQAMGKELGKIMVPRLDEEIVTNFGGTDLRLDHSRGDNYMVPLNTVDNIVGDTPCHFIKIDVEGMELDVLMGAEETIKKHRPILYVDDAADDLNSAILHEYIRSKGYEVHRHVAPGYNPNNYYEDRNDFFMVDGAVVASINLLCLPTEMKCPFDKMELSAMAGSPMKAQVLQQVNHVDSLVKSVKETSHLEGDMAELGVYQGGTAYHIANTNPDKKLHLFDTFSGLPADCTLGVHKKGEFASSLPQVQESLKDCNVVFHPGFFPKTTAGLEDTKYCFVHLDADIYQSTLDALDYFWPRMVVGGIIVLDDFEWMNCPGVAEALKERKLYDRVERTGTFQGRLTKS